MRKGLVLVLVLVLLAAIAASAAAIPRIYYVPEGQAAIVYCASGAPDPRITADRQAIILICHSPSSGRK